MRALSIVLKSTGRSRVREFYPMRFLWVPRQIDPLRLFQHHMNNVILQYISGQLCIHQLINLGDHVRGVPRNVDYLRPLQHLCSQCTADWSFLPL
jgi:hypothetical protein